MANLINTLFPPVVATFMPAFVNTDNARIYFSLSPYNPANSVKHVHVSLVNQLNNENAFTLASGVFISSLNYDTNKQMHFVEIPVSIVSGGMFNINQFYKVQLRFDSYDGIVPTEDVSVNNYLLEQAHLFSEWSTVCLIRAILQPTMELRIFDTSNTEYPGFNQGIIPVSGKMFFGDGASYETETLQSYVIQVLPLLGEEPLLETNTIYTNELLDPNTIEAKVNLAGLTLETSAIFRLRIKAETKNQYSLSKDWEFQIIDFLDEGSFKPEITATFIEETASIVIDIQNPLTVFGTLHVTRSSSVDGFISWEPISTSKIAGSIDISINDNTVGSLIWYRYAVQLENSKGVLTPVYRTPKVLPDFYDAYISRGDFTLKLLYNYKVSSFKPVVNRTKIDTLGGKFPRFAENAILNYKQFNISGTLSAMSDEHELFMSRGAYFGEDYLNYLVYNQAKPHEVGYRESDHDLFINGYAFDRGDFFWEREFREAVVEWLNDGEPKLYRSMAEGSMVVMLTGISLTPRTDIGRRAWDFTATVYEMENPQTLATLDELGIYNVTTDTDIVDEEDIPEEFVNISTVGQLYETTIATSKDNIISNIIFPNLQQQYAGILSNRNPRDCYISSVTLLFHNQPNCFLIIDANGTLQKVSNPSTLTEEERTRIQIGYRFTIKTSNSSEYTTFYVNERGRYELPAELDVIDLSFPDLGDKVTVEYILNYKETVNQELAPEGVLIEKTLLGQERGIFTPLESIGQRIRDKYTFVKTSHSLQQMNSWKGISINAAPYTVAEVLVTDAAEYEDYLIGSTGFLNLLQDFPTQDIRFVGSKLFAAKKERQKYLDAWEYYHDKEAMFGGDNPLSSKDPQSEFGVQYNTVYNINAQTYIYYIDGNWYPFTLNEKEGFGIAQMPVEATINYIGDIVKLNY